MKDIYSLLTLSALLSIALTCTEENINACFVPLETYLDQIHASRDVSENGFALSHLQDTELDGFCSIWENSLSDCLRSLRSQCSLEQRMEFEGIEDGYDFFCSTLERYKPFKPCINSDEVAQGLGACESQLTREITSALYEEKTEHFKQGVCNAVHKAITCDYNTVKAQCGVNAAEWVEQFEELINSKYMDEVHGCSDIGACTLQNEEKCWKTVNDYLESQNQQPIGYREYDYRNLTSHQLGQFCMKYDSSASDCLSDLKASCSDFESQRFEGKEKSLDFLCKDGFAEFLRHRDCLVKQEVYGDEMVCYVQFDRDMYSVYDQPTPEELDKAYCKAIQDLIVCKKTAVTDHCGAEAGEWMQEYDRMWLEPYLDGVTCDNVVGPQCSDGNIDACWAPADTYLSGIDKNRKTLGLALKNLADDQVRSYCKTYNDVVSSCLKDIRGFCQRDPKTLINAQMHSLDYLCGPDLETSLQHRACLTDETVHSQLLQCDLDFEQSSHDASASSSTHEKEKLYCDALGEYKHCDDEVIEKHCDDNSKDWAKKYLSYLRLSLYKDYCNEQGLSGGAKAMIAVFTLLGIALIVALCIIGFYFYKKKKVIKDQNSHVRFENPLASNGPGAEASAYIQNNVSMDSETKTVPVAVNDYSTPYSNAELEAYNAGKTEIVSPPEYSECYEGTASAPQESSDHGYINTEEVKPTIEEADITTTATSNPMYEHSSKY